MALKRKKSTTGSGSKRLWEDRAWKTDINEVKRLLKEEEEFELDDEEDEELDDKTEDVDKYGRYVDPDEVPAGMKTWGDNDPKKPKHNPFVDPEIVRDINKYLKIIHKKNLLPDGLNTDNALKKVMNLTGHKTHGGRLAAYILASYGVEGMDPTRPKPKPWTRKQREKWAKDHPYDPESDGPTWPN